MVFCLFAAITGVASAQSQSADLRSAAGADDLPGWRTPPQAVRLLPPEELSAADAGWNARKPANSAAWSGVPNTSTGDNFRRHLPNDAALTDRRAILPIQPAANWRDSQPPPQPPVGLPTGNGSEDHPVVANEAPYETIAGPFQTDCDSCQHYLQFLPDGLMYKSYLAGEKESRFSSVWLHEEGRGWVWETTIGGRFGLLRHGTGGSVRPQGWQIDIEGAVFPRIDPVERSEMDSVDFRAGIIWTWRSGPLAIKAGYYHISSHIGDEYLLKHPTFDRIEYVRDSTITGVTYNLTDDFAAYGEVGYAVGHLGGAKPWEFQFGLQYSPACSNGHWGSPFAAINGHLREDFDFGGNVTVTAGRQWRSAETDRLFRAGLMYFNGKSLQYQFFDKDEELLGLGMWFDF